ncbi:GtrA family protein, partial [Francisella tularensis subsp. holarctica]|nr:GtrA family protein [Francisella tularensis subsp. holarctica]
MLKKPRSVIIIVGILAAINNFIILWILVEL